MMPECYVFDYIDEDDVYLEEDGNTGWDEEDDE